MESRCILSEWHICVLGAINGLLVGMLLRHYVSCMQSTKQRAMQEAISLTGKYGTC